MLKSKPFLSIKKKPLLEIHEILESLKAGKISITCKKTSFIYSMKKLKGAKIDINRRKRREF